MRAPRSIIGSVSSWPIVRHHWLRRAVVAGLLTVCALLTFFPQPYRASLTLTPVDPTSLGLSGSLVQFGIGNVLGSQTATEVSLTVARSKNVREIVIRKLDLTHRLGKSWIQTHRWLERKMDVGSMRGGIISLEMKDHDAELARMIIDAYGVAVREQLALISQTQTERKRYIVGELVAGADERLSKAQTAYDSFRLRNRYSEPESALMASGDRIPTLEAEVRAKEVELRSRAEFETPQSVRMRQLDAELAALRDQLEDARSTVPEGDGSVGRVVTDSTKAEQLRRELVIARTLYESYRRFLQGTIVEDLSSTANIRILEPASVDTARQINVLPFAFGMLILLAGLAVEFYLARLPVGAGREVV